MGLGTGKKNGVIVNCMLQLKEGDAAKCDWEKREKGIENIINLVEYQ
jgi:hypothetical protein